MSIQNREQYAEQDKARRNIIEESNKAESVCADTEKGENSVFIRVKLNAHWVLAMNEFKDQLDAAEKDKVTKHISELHEIAVKGQAGDGTVTADAIREKINETQQASLGLFQKVKWLFMFLLSCLPYFPQVYEKKNAENSSSSAAEEEKEEKKEEKKD